MTRVMAKCAATGSEARRGLVSRSFRSISQSSGATPLWRQQSLPQQIQVRQGEGGVQPCRVLSRSTVAHLAKSPQALDHVEDMLDTGPSGRAPTIEEPLILAQSPGANGAPIDPIPDAGRQRALAMRLVPVGLIAKHLALRSVQELGHLRAVVDVRRGGAQAVDDPAPVGADVRLHAKVPVFTLLGLAHLRIACALPVLGRGRRSNDGRIHNGAALEQQPLLLEQGSDLGKDLLGQSMLLQQMPETQDRRLVGYIVSVQLDAGETAHRLDVVQRVLGLRVRQVEPVLHEVDAQHLLHRLRLRSVTRLRVMRLNQRQKLVPWNHRVHLGQKTLAARDLALVLPSYRRKRGLPHRSFNSTNHAQCTHYRSSMPTCAEIP